MVVWIMGNKSFEYKQLTVRIPPKIFQKIEMLSKRLSTTIQDTVVFILIDYFEGVEEYE